MTQRNYPLTVQGMGDSKQDNEGCGRQLNPSCSRLWEAPPRKFPTESFQAFRVQCIENIGSFLVRRLLLPGKEALCSPPKMCQIQGCGADIRGLWSTLLRPGLLQNNILQASAALARGLSPDNDSHLPFFGDRQFQNA